MNLTVDQFLSGLGRTVRDLPELLRRWDSLADDLQCAYADQLQWMLDHFDDVQQLARLDEKPRVGVQLVDARTRLYGMRDEILAVTGIVVELASSHDLRLATRMA